MWTLRDGFDERASPVAHGRVMAIVGFMAKRRMAPQYHQFWGSFGTAVFVVPKCKSTSFGGGCARKERLFDAPFPHVSPLLLLGNAWKVGGRYPPPPSPGRPAYAQPLPP